MYKSLKIGEKVKQNIIVIALVLMSVKTFGFEFDEECNDVKKCIKKVSSYTGVKYIYPKDLKKSATSFTGLKVTKENIEEIFSEFLATNNLARVKINETTYKIIPARDIRYNFTENVEASFKKAPKFPKTNDFYSMTYRLKSPHMGASVSRSLRPFMSRYGRVIDIKGSQKIIVQDRKRQLLKIYNLIREADILPTKEALKKLNRYENSKRDKNKKDKGGPKK